MDRRVRVEDYAIFMAAGDAQVEIDDPLGRLVYGFADRIREAELDCIRSDADAIRHRARLYRVLVERY